MNSIRIKISGVMVAILTIILVTKPGYAFKERSGKDTLEKREFALNEIYISQSNVPIDQVISQLANADAWQEFNKLNPNSDVYIDPRSGKPSSITSAIPLIPGTGDRNTLLLKDIGAQLGYEVEVIGKKEMQQIVQQFLQKHIVILGVDMNEIGEIRLGHNIDYLWQIFIMRQFKGIPVRDANMTLTVNHGNLVLWGLEKWGVVDASINPTISREQALSAGFNYLTDSKNRVSDFISAGMRDTEKIDDEDSEAGGYRFMILPHLELAPVSPANWAGALGGGYHYRLVWAYTFRKAGFINTWEMLVDAHSGEILSFQDQNQYVLRKIVGNVYPLSNDGCCPEGCAAQAGMKYADIVGYPTVYTSLNGLYNYTSGTPTTHLSGQYIRDDDKCGGINETSTTGDFDLSGFTGDHDCTIPGGHSAGDTMASRSGETELTAINRIARGWVSYPWIDTQVTATYNITKTCNAYWTGASLEFFRSGNGCRNTGEIAAVFDHEWGHGLDQNDTNGQLSHPGEAYADMLAILRLHNSCAGRGFYDIRNQGCGFWNCPATGVTAGANCNGYGDCCLQCTGIRDADYQRHSSGAPHTPINFNCPNCRGTSGGPCGREVHCENAPVIETVWDVAERDLQSSPFNYDKNSAFEIATRLAYLGSGNVSNWYSCDCNGSTADGCGSNNGYKQWIAADDEDGNLNNGTPHMTAIYNAFNRHGIACSSPTVQNSTCASGPTAIPTLVVSGSSNSAQLTIIPVAGAVGYYIYKTTGPLGCDFGKIKIATIAGTTYTDEALDCSANHYQVQAVGANAACFSQLSGCASVVPPDNPPAMINVYSPGPGRIQVEWPSVPGVTSYNVYRKYEWCNKVFEEKIASNVIGTTYLDSSVSSGVIYDYSVSSITGCESGHGVWGSGSAEGTCSLPSCFAGISNVANQETNPCELRSTWEWASSGCSQYPGITYAIYRSTDPNFIPSSDNLLIACYGGNMFIDGDVAFGQTYYYIVRAEDSRPGGGNGPCNGGNLNNNMVRKSATASGPVITLLADGFESGLSNWTISGNWGITATSAHSGIYSAHSGNMDNRACDTMSLANAVTIPPSSSTSLKFWTRHLIEEGYDGGIVQYSTDGANWNKLFFTLSYPGFTNPAAQACLGPNPQPAFTGDIYNWSEYTSMLNNFAGNSFRIRFNYATDSSNANGGWWIDDVTIKSQAFCQNGSSSCTTPPLFAGLTSAESWGTSICHITLTWDDATSTCPSGDDKSYHIYRSTNPNFVPSPANRIAECIPGTSFTDHNVVAGTTYYYIVRAEDSTVGGNGPCNGGNIDLNYVRKSADPAIVTGFTDNFESGLSKWSISSRWTTSNNYAYEGTYSAFSGDENNQVCDTMAMVNFVNLPFNSSPYMSFWTRYELENGYDAGIVEASSNGIVWSKLTLTPDYPGTTNTGAQSCLGSNPQSAFTDVFQPWEQYSADLSSFANGNFKARFKIATDGSNVYGGWYLDNVLLKYYAYCAPGFAPGTVPDNDNYPGIPLRITKSSSNLNLIWGAPGGTCQTQNYEIYRGTLPWQGYNYFPIVCSTGGTSYTIVSDSGSYYYDIVAVNQGYEGSYGLDSANTQRTQSAAPCLPILYGNCN